MNKEGFFSEMTSSANGEAEKILDLLRARGLLITSEPGRNYLAEGTITLDLWHLDQWLREYRIGFVDDDGVITILETATASPAKQLFSSEGVREAMCPMTYFNSWRVFFSEKERGHVAACELEPFVARYIRALNSCGVYTISSCDGNHGKSDEMLVNAYGEPSVLLHQAICRALIDHTKYPHLRWNHVCTKIRFTEETKYDVYFELNRFAEFLYKCKDILMEIKREIGEEIAEQYDYTESEAINAVFPAKAIRYLRTI